MTVRPETGKLYKTRDGQKAGPIRGALPGTLSYQIGEVDGVKHIWYSNGSYYRYGQSPLDLVAEWTDEPKTLGEMSDEEASALWLAWRRGERIQFYNSAATWVDCYRKPRWTRGVRYRVKPKPEVKTVPVSCYVGGSTHIEVGKIDLIDGKPDLTSLMARADE